MKLGEPVPYDGSVKAALPHEIIVINETIIKKVNTFKFLGVWIRPNLSNAYHLAKRKSAAYASVGELNVLGWNEDNILPEAKGLLVQTYIRPKILYGTENCNLLESDIKEIHSFECSLVKRSYNMPSSTMNTPLIAALGIPTIKEAIEKRALSFVMELVRNRLTRKLVLLKDETCPIWKTINKLNLSPEFDTKTEMERACEIYFQAKEEIEKIDKASKSREDSRLTKVVRYLLKNRNKENNDGLLYLINNRNRVEREIDAG